MQISSYAETVSFLESLQIMPKTMPGLQKITKALNESSWYSEIDPSRVIVVAGTNGKGTTSAALEALLIEAGCKVGFYSSPHLVSTTERIRVNSNSISEAEFVKVFNRCKPLIDKHELSHFEALTLMAGEYFFNADLGLDYFIFEVGLGGLYDATNAFPHKYSVITKLGLDHVNILGDNLVEIAKNKFGIVSRKNIVAHHILDNQLLSLKNEVQKATNSNWIEAARAEYLFEKERHYINYLGEKIEINMVGDRAVENISTAITVFESLGYDLHSHMSALKKIKWQGRMQQIKWPGIKSPVYLSGDHNEQGVDSLISILNNNLKYEKLYLVVGVGKDKDADMMLTKLSQLPNATICLTETPFKGLKIEEYAPTFVQKSLVSDSDVFSILNHLREVASPNDLVVITGSLYLVGKVLSKI